MCSIFSKYDVNTKLLTNRGNSFSMANFSVYRLYQLQLVSKKKNETPKKKQNHFARYFELFPLNVGRKIKANPQQQVDLFCLQSLIYSQYNKLALNFLLIAMQSLAFNCICNASIVPVRMCYFYTDALDDALDDANQYLSISCKQAAKRLCIVTASFMQCHLSLARSIFFSLSLSLSLILFLLRVFIYFFCFFFSIF